MSLCSYYNYRDFIKKYRNTIPVSLFWYPEQMKPTYPACKYTFNAHCYIMVAKKEKLFGWPTINKFIIKVVYFYMKCCSDIIGNFYYLVRKGQWGTLIEMIPTQEYKSFVFFLTWWKEKIKFLLNTWKWLIQVTWSI